MNRLLVYLIKRNVKNPQYFAKNPKNDANYFATKLQEYKEDLNQNSFNGITKEKTKTVKIKCYEKQRHVI